MTFDKFAWLRALRADPLFSDKEVRVAMAVCTDYVRRDGTGWMVDLDVLAASVPGGMSRNRLKTALLKLTDHGYLIETNRTKGGRTTGGRGQTARRAHDLAGPPKPASSAVQVDGDTRTSSDAGLSPTRTSSGSNLHQRRFQPAPAAVQKVPAELQESGPLGTYGGTYGGTGGDEVSMRTAVDRSSDAPTTNTEAEEAEAFWLQPPPEDPPGGVDEESPAAAADSPTDLPSAWEVGRFGPRCLEHLNVEVPPKCIGCKHARVAAKETAAAAEAAKVAAATARADAKRLCKACDEGWVIDKEGKPVEPAQKCKHPNVPSESDNPKERAR